MGDPVGSMVDKKLHPILLQWSWTSSKHPIETDVSQPQNLHNMPAAFNKSQDTPYINFSGKQIENGFTATRIS